MGVAVSANEMKISREGPHGTTCLKMSLEFTFPIPDLLDTLSSYARISPSAGSSRDAMAASRSPSSDPTQTTREAQTSLGAQPVDPADADDARSSMVEVRRLLGPVAEAAESPDSN